MSGFGSSTDMGTLDEPVTTTIMRDVSIVGNKMLCVLNPRKANLQTLKNWDLWGPLVLCLMLATLLSWFAPYDQKSLVFASVFVIICCGATVRRKRKGGRESEGRGERQGKNGERGGTWRRRR